MTYGRTMLDSGGLLSEIHKGFNYHYRLMNNIKFNIYEEKLNLSVATATTTHMSSSQDSYTPPSAPFTLEIISDDANDADGGTGAERIIIVGLDASNNAITETLTTNGITAVIGTASTWKRVFYATSYDQSAITKKVAIGNITIRISSGGASQGRILATTDEFRAMRSTISRLFTGFVCAFEFGADKLSYFDIFINNVREHRLYSNTKNIAIFPFPDKLNAGDDIRVDVVTTTTTTDVWSKLYIFEINTDKMNGKHTNITT